MSENLAMALLNRGFGASSRLTFFDEIRMKKNDYLALAVNLFFLTAVFIVYFLHFGQL
jgi:energy-coupling factor transporter transmembrane protein EcfT